MTNNPIDRFVFESNHPSLQFLKRDYRDAPYLNRIGMFVLRIVLAVARDFADGTVTLRAMSLVYTTLLSIVPVMAISFSVLKGFGVHNQAEPMLAAMLEPLGKQGETITKTVIGFVDNMQVGLLGSLGLAMLLYTVVSLLQKVEGAFNAQWRIERPRSLARRFSDYLSVVLVAPILIFTSFGLSTSLRTTPLVQELAAIAHFGPLFSMGIQAVPFLMSVIGFTFFYIFIPNTQVRILPALGGALTATILWKATGFIFTTFIVSSGQYAAIYSAFTALILLLIWTYLTWVILISGATVSYYIQNPSAAIRLGEGGFISNTARERLALMIMKEVLTRFYRGSGVMPLDVLTARINAHPIAVSRTIDALVQAGLLLHEQGSSEYVSPSKPPEDTPLAALIHAVNDYGSNQVVATPLIIDEVQERLDKAIDYALDGRTLKDLVD